MVNVDVLTYDEVGSKAASGYPDIIGTMKLLSNESRGSTVCRKVKFWSLRDQACSEPRTARESLISNARPQIRCLFPHHLLQDGDVLPFITESVSLTWRTLLYCKPAVVWSPLWLCWFVFLCDSVRADGLQSRGYFSVFLMAKQGYRNKSTSRAENGVVRELLLADVDFTTPHT